MNDCMVRMSLQHAIVFFTTTLVDKVNLMVSFSTLSVGLWRCFHYLKESISVP